MTLQFLSAAISLGVITLITAGVMQGQSDRAR
jgi:hypothetical protein